MKLTKAQRAALERARARGAVFAGADVERGSVVRTSASAIRALARRGLVELATASEGGLCGVITEAGRAALGAAE